MVVYIYYTVKQRLEIPSARGYAAPVTAKGIVRKRQYGMARPSRTNAGVTLLQQARRAAVLGQPSSLQPQWVLHEGQLVA